jgi:oligoribonuclease NrnB/cAMP/cGMP phosphodiesterase (DHH superfamily)
MVDMAYPRERHLELEKKVKSLTVVDHHITAQQAIGDLPNTHFDMNHSGATLAWMFLHPGVPVPELLLYVEDRDLWRYKLPDSREFFTGLSSYEKQFDLWETINCNFKDQVGKLKEEGKVLLRLQTRKVNEMCESVFWKEIAGHRVPVVNATTFTSEVGERLNQLYPDAAFSAFYYDKEKIRCWGLRSQGKTNVAEIARSLGGGGHPNASGFSRPIGRVEEAARDLVDDMRGRINDAGGKAIYNPGMMNAFERLEKALGAD